MFEKVNPCHPDKVADRIAGAIVDIAYKKVKDPKIAVEVLIGHEKCTVIIETDVFISRLEVREVVERIAGISNIDYTIVSQDEHLANNQSGKIRCGDNGIFKGTKVTEEQIALIALAKRIFEDYGTDGKYIVDGDRYIICQSNADTEELKKKYPNQTINPLGNWKGGTKVDSGATNRKLGSDMGDSVTGGGLHGKDLSKADVSVNIYAWLKAQRTGEEVNLCCAIGDEYVDDKPYSEIVEIARNYINSIGGFEKFAEWGLLR